MYGEGVYVDLPPWAGRAVIRNVDGAGGEALLEELSPGWGWGWKGVPGEAAQEASVPMEWDESRWDISLRISRIQASVLSSMAPGRGCVASSVECLPVLPVLACRA